MTARARRTFLLVVLCLLQTPPAAVAQEPDALPDLLNCQLDAPAPVPWVNISFCNPLDTTVWFNQVNGPLPRIINFYFNEFVDHM